MVYKVTCWQHCFEHLSAPGCCSTGVDKQRMFEDAANEDEAISKAINDISIALMEQGYTISVVNYDGDYIDETTVIFSGPGGRYDEVSYFGFWRAETV